ICSRGSKASNLCEGFMKHMAVRSLVANHAQSVLSVIPEAMDELCDTMQNTERNLGDKHAHRAIAKHQKDLEMAREQVKNFLIKNGFPTNNVNCKRRHFLTVTYPLHQAVKQNNPYITYKLLIFGANPLAKDVWGRTAYDYTKGHASHEKIRQVFEKLGMSPNSPRWHASSKLQLTPPPIGWERFFAKVAQDPLVQTPNSEEQWFQELGARSTRGFARTTTQRVEPRAA
ncbi:Mitotic checkpoint protein BUB3.2, partial [Durusdinium trenchii]